MTGPVFSFDRDAELLLVVSPTWLTRMPPLGVAYLVTFLKSRGHRVEVADLNVELFNNASEQTKRLWDIGTINGCPPREIADKVLDQCHSHVEQFVEAVLQTNIPVIGFSTTAASTFAAEGVAKRIKERDPSRIVVFGGPGSHWDHQRVEIELNCVNYFIVGEGEEALDALLRHLKHGDPPEQEIPGLIAVRDGVFHRIRPPQPIRNLDLIPYPTFEEFDLKKYNDGNAFKPLPLILSRGCVRRCTFCIDWVLSPQYRYRKPELVFENLAHYVSRYGARHFEFNDLLCNGVISQLERFCDLMIEAQMGVYWWSYAIIRKEMTPALLKKMKASGCAALIYGVESASDGVLKRMRKNVTGEITERVVRDTHDAGIFAQVNVVVGFPGETEEEFQDTVTFLKRNKDYIHEVTNISGLVLMNGSELMQEREKFGIEHVPGSDPGLFKDENGLDQMGRHDRVTRLVKIVDDLGLRTQIINTPNLSANVC